MKLSGEANLQAAVAEVYAALHDPAVLVRTIPGCQRLEQTGPDTFKATVLAGVAAITGTFDGDVRLSDQSPPDSFVLHASGAGAPGTVNAVVQIALRGVESGGTHLRYDADAAIGGVIGGVGQRMLTSVAKKTAGEFFAAVDRELSGAPAAVAAAAAGPVPVPAPAVWTRPAPVVDVARQRVRDLLVGAALGAIVALLGVLVGAIVAHW